ncbi:FkbM family methyltransferase [Arenibaculum pallidiluteum]|uniref:FkbM family methyltransferase n=1 Tax=Arenibaculum pallidiluteum TaxID=2812559 RepID=UPI001A963747|nr:FkbM family methyltransferase [Arenibaculum pallidiluteum]
MTTSAPIPLQVQGLGRSLAMRVHDRTDIFVSASIRQHGYWEPQETLAFCNAVQPGMTVVDIGANIGYYTILAAARVGASGRVFAFEPDPVNAALLRENVALNQLDNVQVIEAAIGADDGVLPLHISPTNLGDHRLYDTGEVREVRQVAVRSLDRFLRAGALVPGLVKIDTQGFEPVIFGSLLPWCRATGHWPTIFSEFWPYAIERAGGSYVAFLEMLHEANLDYWLILEESRRAVPLHISEMLRLSQAGYREAANNDFAFNFIARKPRFRA